MDNDEHQVWQIRFQVEKIPCDQGDQGKSHVISVICMIRVIISAFTGRQPSQINENWPGWEGFLGEVRFF